MEDQIQDQNYEQPLPEPEEIEAEINRYQYHQQRDDEYLAELHQQKRAVNDAWRDY